MPELSKTPLNAVHRESGARMVPFGGWDMPVEYSGLIAEHLAVRQAAGLFDVSHMGELEVAGPRAEGFLQRVTANNVASLKDGQAQYSALPLPTGAPVDDVIVYRHAPDLRVGTGPGARLDFLVAGIIVVERSRGSAGIRGNVQVNILCVSAVSILVAAMPRCVTGEAAL